MLLVIHHLIDAIERLLFGWSTRKREARSGEPIDASCENGCAA